MFYLKACKDGFYIACQVKSGGGVIALPGFGGSLRGGVCVQELQSCREWDLE
jgi:hypothetical protein